jgi:hypothetical protein
VSVPHSRPTAPDDGGYEGECRYHPWLRRKPTSSSHLSAAGAASATADALRAAQDEAGER